MNRNQIAILAALAASIALTACAPKNPDYTGKPSVAASADPKPLPKNFEKKFSYGQAEVTTSQDQNPQNNVSVLFDVKDKSGASVNSLGVKDFHVTENGANITPFTVEPQKKTIDQFVEIMFVIDVTNSMGPFIEMTKAKLQQFVSSSRKDGYHTRICFTTFGDYTVLKCSRFYDNDPKDPTTLAQNKELLSELSKIHAFLGKSDPGGKDFDENPLRALMDASQAPWTPGIRHFAILVTDAGFLSAPDNMGTTFKSGLTEAQAPMPPGHILPPPTFADAVAAIQSAKMEIFSVTRGQFAGYSGDLPDGTKSLVNATGGQHFEFEDVLKSRPNSNLKDILSSITDTIVTTYLLKYNVETAGARPNLKIDQRDVAISMANSGVGTPTIRSKSQDVAGGNPEYKKTFSLGDQAVQPGSVHAFVNGKELAASEFTADKNNVTFKTAPAPGAKLRFTFYYENIDKNFHLEPLIVGGAIDQRTTKIYLNGVEARAEDVSFVRTADGNTSVAITESAMADNDPYSIRKDQGLKIRVVTNAN